MRVVRCDGSRAAVDELADALTAALDGGPAVLPYDAERAPDVGSVPDGAALLVETSGSTGSAKRVVLSAAALRASALATQARLGGPGRWLLALPAHHVAGAQVIVRGLLAGHRPVTLERQSGFRPEGFARAAEELLGAGGRASGGPGSKGPDSNGPDSSRPDSSGPDSSGRCYVSLVPTQLHRVLSAGGAALAALRGFDAVLLGGAAAPATLLDAARAEGVRVHTTYGMSETAGGCVYDGRPLDGVRVRISPADGRIELSGPMLADGYLNRPELTAECFVDGWFRTSDLGELAADGTLRVLGRADDVITTGGESVHPAAVERVLAAQPGVRAACVVGLPDPEWGQLVAAALVLDRPSGAGPPGAALPDGDGSGHGPGPVGEAGRLGDAVRATLGPPSVPRLVRVLPELPLRGIGKPDRVEVARLLAESR